jgi:hypothetical protein
VLVTPSRTRTYRKPNGTIREKTKTATQQAYKKKQKRKLLQPDPHPTQSTTGIEGQ